MSETVKSIRAAAGIAVLSALVFVGARLRDWADLRDGEQDRVAVLPSAWLASRDKEVKVPVVSYYHEMTRLLKEKYVEPIKDDQKLAGGAVRGMIASLGDPRSLYYDKSEFDCLLNAREGKYTGIGVDLALRGEAKAKKPAVDGEPSQPADGEEAVAMSEGMPRLQVSLVVPGSNADKAGLKAGDTILTVDGRWIVESSLLLRFRQAQKLFDDKKITFKAINDLRKELKKKTDRALMPLKARDILMSATSGIVRVEWMRGGKTFNAAISKGASNLVWGTQPNGKLALSFTPSGLDSLKSALAKKPTQLELDLRNNLYGDFETMRQALALVAPAGSYGALKSSRKEAPAPIVTSKGTSSGPSLTLITDGTTEGAAAAFALALSSNGKAKIVGSEVGPDRSKKEVVRLPDGSGFTLVVGDYTANKSTEVSMKKRGAK